MFIFSQHQMPLAGTLRPMFLGRVPRSLLAAAMWFALLCWGATILWLSSLTPDELPSAPLFGWDKLNHFVAFAAGGWLAASALQASRRGGSVRWKIIAAIVIVAVFGMVDEMRQLLTPGRSGADLYDWIADFLGAGAGAILSMLTYDRLDRCLARS